MGLLPRLKEPYYGLEPPYAGRIRMSLRADIREYESNNNTKVKCFGVVRCLYCPMSAAGCPMARGMIKTSPRNPDS